MRLVQLQMLHRHRHLTVRYLANSGPNYQFRPSARASQDTFGDTSLLALFIVSVFNVNQQKNIAPIEEISTCEFYLVRLGNHLFNRDPSFPQITAGLRHFLFDGSVKGLH